MNAPRFTPRPAQAQLPILMSGTMQSLGGALRPGVGLAWGVGAGKTGAATNWHQLTGGRSLFILNKPAAIDTAWVPWMDGTNGIRVPWFDCRPIPTRRALLAQPDPGIYAITSAVFRECVKDQSIMAGPAYDRVVIDEADYLCNWTAPTAANTVRFIERNRERQPDAQTVLLTATPDYNHHGEWYGILRAIDRRAVHNLDYDSFVAKWRMRAIMRWVKGQRVTVGHKLTAGTDDHEAFHQYLKRWVWRIRTEDIEGIQLPQRDTELGELWPFQLGPAERHLYDELAELSEQQQASEKDNRGTMIRMRLMTSGLLGAREPDGDTTPGDLAKDALRVGNSRPEAVANLMRTHEIPNDRRCAVWASFRLTATAIADTVSGPNCNAHVVLGGMTDKRRNAVVRACMADPKGHLIATMGTLGVGTDGLQHALDTTIFAELGFSARAVTQSSGRVNRPGRLGRLYREWWLVATDTIDEAAVKACIEKAERSMVTA